MWKLSEDHCKKIATEKSETCLFTLTDYNKNWSRDNLLIQILKKNYNNLVFFPQGPDDEKYLQSFEVKPKIIERDFNAFKNFTKKNKFDYIGTRLHAGIYCLEHFKRSIIIGVDNRAIEIGKDSNLLVIPRENIHELENLIKSEIKTKILLPNEAITRWKNQF